MTSSPHIINSQQPLLSPALLIGWHVLTRPPARAGWLTHSIGADVAILSHSTYICRYVLCDAYAADRKSGSGGRERGLYSSRHLPYFIKVGAKTTTKIPCSTLYTLFLYDFKHLPSLQLFLNYVNCARAGRFNEYFTIHFPAFRFALIKSARSRIHSSLHSSKAISKANRFVNC